MKVVDWFKEGWMQKKQQETASLQEKLKCLYGQLHFLTSQNREYFELASKITTAHIQLYEGREFAPQSMPVVEAEGEKTIAVSNAYAALVKENNAQIRKLLQENWNLIDEDDVEVFTSFLSNHARMNTESSTGSEKGLPVRVLQRLDPIYYMPPGFVERVDSKWKAMRARLDYLRNARWWW